MIALDGVPHRGLRWRTQTTTLTRRWTEALDSTSDGAWLGDGDAHRERVAGRSAVEIGWVEGGYVLGALEEE